MANRQRRSFKPERWTVYENHGGGTFRCLAVDQYYNSAQMQNTRSGWTFQARGLHKYQDGTIDWDYSVGGQFLGGRKG